MTPFLRGKVYKRSEISRAIGGGVQDFLPHANGRVVAGCFSRDVNPDAPTTILPGSGPEIEKWARVFATQDTPIPVFVKQRSNEWHCFGYFRCVKLDASEEAVAAQMRRTNRADITMVLTLERDKTISR